MESILNSQLLVYLQDHRLINNRQYGFRYGRSTSNLLTYLAHWQFGHGEGLWPFFCDMGCSLLNYHPMSFPRISGKFSLGTVSTSLSTVFAQNTHLWTMAFPKTCCAVRAVPYVVLLHINDVLEESSIHCYADDSTVGAVYFGRANCSRKNVDQCRNNLVS